MFTWISSINTSRGAAAARASSTGGRGETEQQQARRVACRGEGAARQLVGARRGVAGDRGGRTQALVHRIVEAGSSDARSRSRREGSRRRTGGSSRWTRGSSRRTRGSSRKMRGSSCSAGSWWEIPATSAGNPARGDRCGTGLGGGGGAGTWRRRRRRRYVATEAEHFLMGSKSRSQIGRATCRERVYHFV